VLMELLVNIDIIAPRDMMLADTRTADPSAPLRSGWDEASLCKIEVFACP
jgi:hypothetical protein